MDPLVHTRFAFFTGKGGVGKTSVACSQAIALADGGRRVLLISTDPASNLDEVLETPLGSEPRPVARVPNLWAANLDPHAAAAAYRERVVAPYRGVLPAASITSIEEQLSGACTVEIAAFEEFASLLAEPARTRDFDCVLLDTAPTGHTLRLMELPAAWSGFIDSSSAGVSCLGPLAGLQGQRALYASAVETLKDAEQTTVVLVSRPDPSALTEAARTHDELAASGIHRRVLVVNGVYRASDSTDSVARSFEKRAIQALAAIPDSISKLQRSELPLLASNLIGPDVLRSLGKPAQCASAPQTEHSETLPSLSALLDSLSTMTSGIVLVMGKGGVGKTTIAAALAVELASRGRNVELTTTDPAAHVAATVHDKIENLHVTRIDPAEVTRQYVADVLGGAGAALDEQARTLIEEELRSPCTEEIAVFRAFANSLDRAEHSLVIMDTAPTGHTLLLLDAAQAYHREIGRSRGEVPESVRKLLPRLRDPSFTRLILVTLPEATPVHEAAALQADLRRAGIDPFAWIINQSLSPISLHDPVLLARKAVESRYLREVGEKHARRSCVVPAIAEPLIGVRALRALFVQT